MLTRVSLVRVRESRWQILYIEVFFLLEIHFRLKTRELQWTIMLMFMAVILVFVMYSMAQLFWNQLSVRIWLYGRPPAGHWEWSEISKVIQLFTSVAVNKISPSTHSHFAYTNLIYLTRIPFKLNAYVVLLPLNISSLFHPQPS